MKSALAVLVAVVPACALIRAVLATPPRRPTSTRSLAPSGSKRSAAVADAFSGWLMRQRQERGTRAAWPAIADEVGAGLRSGASLRQALAGAAERGGAAGARLAAVVQTVDRGAGLAYAAASWMTEARDEGELLVAQAVELAATGHATPLLFDTVADGLRERAALAGEVRAQTAQARASALALALLPGAFTALLALTDPDVPAFLFRTVPGWACLALGVVGQAAGGWWMHRIVAGVAT